ncbi:ATP-binding protein [Lacibacter sp. H375]|uniref:sensor histidine kinase n=1 Tax=Lacibacter sp. H375 TaxID=3133424 RepID=UPI0030BFE4F7
MYRNHRKHFIFLSNFYLQEVELLEQERNRIARDLHDELGPLVSIAHLLIHNSKGAAEEDREYLSKAEQSLHELTERFREIAKNLTPDVLSGKGLHLSIERFLNRYSSVSTIQFQFNCKLSKEPAQNFGLQIYRLVQELVHNAIKHSDAKEVTLTLVERNGLIHLFYKDDGKGMESDFSKDGIGIKSMRSRVTMLNGYMEMNSKHGKGTEFYFALPINKHYE